jgi:hypothetical protein
LPPAPPLWLRSVVSQPERRVEAAAPPAAALRTDVACATSTAGAGAPTGRLHGHERERRAADRPHGVRARPGAGVRSLDGEQLQIRATAGDGYAHGLNRRDG